MIPGNEIGTDQARDNGWHTHGGGRARLCVALQATTAVCIFLSVSTAALCRPLASWSWWFRAFLPVFFLFGPVFGYDVCRFGVQVAWLQLLCMIVFVCQVLHPWPRGLEVTHSRAGLFAFFGRRAYCVDRPRESERDNEMALIQLFEAWQGRAVKD